MRHRGPPFIKQRRTIFVGCEGQSEVGYVALLQDMIRVAGLPVRLEIHELSRGAGDPLGRIEMAIRRLRELGRSRIEPIERFILLDYDQAEADPGRAEKAVRLAAGNNIQIVWQRPCFEAVLLRHLPHFASRQPYPSQEALRALQREWPLYRKPMTRAELSRLINLEGVLRAATVEPELSLLLQCIGLTA